MGSYNATTSTCDKGMAVEISTFKDGEVHFGDAGALQAMVSDDVLEVELGKQDLVLALLQQLLIQ